MTTALFGGGGGTKTPRYTGLSIQTSTFDKPIPIMWGENRLTDNVIWWNDFKSYAKSSGKGGLGGGKGGTTYTYTVATILAICEGQIQNIGKVWQNQNITTLSKLGLTLFNGSPTQTPWSYVTTNHPTEALSYANTAYVASSALKLGSSPNLPALSYEVIGNLSGTMPGTPDANMGDIIPDFLTNTRYGLGLTSSNIDSTSLAFYKTYCQAQGLFFSPVLESLEKATDILNRWAILTNTFIFWSGNVIKFVPLGDTAVTGNGATYTPSNPVVYSLTINDFTNKDAPVKTNRVDPADAYNRTRIDVHDRSVEYNLNPVEYKDQTLVDLYGVRDNSVVSGNELCDAGVGLICATLIGKRAAYIRNTYAFSLPYDFILLEPGDIVQITDPNVAAITNLPVRITKVEESDTGELQVDAEEFPGTIGTFYSQPAETAAPAVFNQLVDPGNVNDPCIFEPNSALAGPNSQPQVWMAVSGGVNWGSADIFVSFDGGATYTQRVGTITAPALQGKLSGNLAAGGGNPDNVHTLGVDLTESLGVLNPVTHADADAFRTLSYLSVPSSGGAVAASGELLSYGTVTATGTYTDNLTYLWRGLYNTTNGSHSTNDNFTVLDLTGATGSLFKYVIPAQYIGSTIYIKFVSRNVYGMADQDISTVTAYHYTTTGAGYGSGTLGVPATPFGFVVSAGVGGNPASWNANAATDNVTSYKLYRAAGTGQPFGSSTLVKTVAGGTTSTVDNTATAGSPYTYFLSAVNAAGESAPTAGVNVSTSGGPTSGQLRISGGTPGVAPTASQELFNPPMKTGDKWAATAPGSLITCETPPAADWTLTFKKNGTTVGTAKILATANSGTFTVASDVNFTDGDSFTAICPVTPDANIKGVGYTLVMTRTQ